MDFQRKISAAEVALVLTGCAGLLWWLIERDRAPAETSLPISAPATAPTMSQDGAARAFSTYMGAVNGKFMTMEIVRTVAMGKIRQDAEFHDLGRFRQDAEAFKNQTDKLQSEIGDLRPPLDVTDEQGAALEEVVSAVQDAAIAAESIAVDWHVYSLTGLSGGGEMQKDLDSLNRSQTAIKPKVLAAYRLFGVDAKSVDPQYLTLKERGP